MSVAPAYRPGILYLMYTARSRIYRPVRNSLAGQHASFYINYHRPFAWWSAYSVCCAIVTSIKTYVIFLSSRKHPVDTRGGQLGIRPRKFHSSGKRLGIDRTRSPDYLRFSLLLSPTPRISRTRNHRASSRRETFTER